MARTKIDPATATEAQKLGMARNAATLELRAAHEPEFNELMVKKAKALGVTWSPRLTDEQKAAAEIKRLLEANPKLDITSLVGPETTPPEDTPKA